MSTKHIDADPTTRDAFGSLRVSEKTTVQDSQNATDFDTRFFYNAAVYDSETPVKLAEHSNASGVGANGSLIGPLDPNSRMVPLELDDGYAVGQVVVQMKEYATYTPGKSQIFYHTGILSPNINKPNEQIRIILRTSCSGSIDDIPLEQANWNVDTLDGSGGASNPSGITLIAQNIQLFWVDAQMLYAGRLRCGFSIGGIGGINITVHDKNIANTQNLPTLQNYNLPHRFEISNVSGRAASRSGLFDKFNGIFIEVEDDFLAGKAKIWMKCHAVQSEGGADLGGIPSTEYKLTNTTSINDTLKPILSIRPEEFFNGFPNNSLLFPISFGSINSGQNDCILVLVHGADITGGTWDLPVDAVGPNHHTYKINTTATAMSGGHFITSIPLIKALGSKTESIAQGIKHLRVPVLYSRIDDLTILPETLTVAAISNVAGTTMGLTTLDIEEVRQ